jgi:NAD(P)-dependent dehydrogenase (short-subunit alcohol dehydrogenase family)
MSDGISDRPVSLVTGAGRGIGRGIAVELAKFGHAIVVNYAGNTSAAEECLRLVREAGGDGIIARADVSSSEDRGQLVQKVFNVYGRVDLLVNNAGIAPSVRADLLESGEESFDRLISVNLKGPYFLTQQIALKMIEQVRSCSRRGWLNSGSTFMKCAPASWRPT